MTVRCPDLSRRSLLSVRSGLVFAPLLALACGGGGGQDNKDAGVPPTRVTGVLAELGARKVDVLFVIDDSSSMAPAQANLVASFPAFMETLRALPAGAPDLHIAVISSDMGAGDGSIPGCAGVGKAGRFQFAARGACAATNLQADATFITDAGGGVTNYTGNIEDVFGCIAPLGESGCGFEQPFAAITRALGADGRGNPPADNAGFLRPDARLAIVMLTNEDDCTPRAGTALFDATSNITLASPLGPPTSFRCNEFGHLCSGAAPARVAPNGLVGDMFTYDNCEPAEGAGMLESVADTVGQIKGLKAEPAGQILMASIQGSTGPYVVHWRDPLPPDTMPWPEITHSCTAPDLSFADPGIRTANLAFGFGAMGFVFSICDYSFALGLSRFASAIGGLFSPSCIAGEIADDVTRPGSQPACDDNGGTPPCWSLVAGGPLCVGQVLQLTADAAAPPPTVAYDCGVCTPGVAVRGCR